MKILPTRLTLGHAGIIFIILGLSYLLSTYYVLA